MTSRGRISIANRIAHRKYRQINGGQIQNPEHEDLDEPLAHGGGAHLLGDDRVGQLPGAERHEAIRRAVKRAGAKATDVAVAISGDAAITKVIQMPSSLS